MAKRRKKDKDGQPFGNTPPLYDRQTQRADSPRADHLEIPEYVEMLAEMPLAVSKIRLLHYLSIGVVLLVLVILLLQKLYSIDLYTYVKIPLFTILGLLWLLELAAIFSLPMRLAHRSLSDSEDSAPTLKEYVDMRRRSGGLLLKSRWQMKKEQWWELFIGQQLVYLLNSYRNYFINLKRKYVKYLNHSLVELKTADYIAHKVEFSHSSIANRINLAKILLLLAENSQTPNAAIYANLILEKIQWVMNQYKLNPYIEILAAFHNALAINNRWADYTKAEYLKAGHILLTYNRPDLDESDAGKAIIELEQAGFRTVPDVDLNFFQEDADSDE